LPLPLERGVAILAGAWFVNLVNFMDGIDWITVIGCGVPLAALALLAALQGGESEAAWVLATALAGALIGFAPFNQPVARVFLGDVGSLPIGLILGYGLYRLALAGHLAAALILPLYYLWDSGSTLARRLARGEAFWQAHRSHIYQRATDAGWSVMAVVAQILFLNVALALIAIVTVWQSSTLVSIIALAVAAGLVGLASKRLLAGPSAREAPR
jgi:UDP-N-acetylmuramyl pentapeptide phosphotransferase/UDP-N-acetylglucosamine-1-phosphate transferase